MRAIRSTSATLFAAGVAGAVLSLVAPAATAQTSPPVAPFAFRVLPSTITPGGQVTLSVPGCNASFATASSGVFDAVSIPRGRSVTVTVDRDARRGAVYSVTFTCPGEVSAQAQNSSADLTIAGGTAPPTTSSTSVPTYPSAAALGVRGGLGGSVAGMQPTEIAAGAGLFLVAALGTGYVVRRRAARRH